MIPRYARPFLAPILLFLAALAFASTAHAADGPATVVYLVRHAEKAEGPGSVEGKGPDLTAAGKARAELLASMLRAESIDHVHSTDTTRTLETARPLAEKLGRKVDLYDPGALKELAVELIHAGGRHVVVGHSNTTPALVELLGGDPGEEIDESTEYDRLYAVVIDGDGNATTLHLRFGPPPMLK